MAWVGGDAVAWSEEQGTTIQSTMAKLNLFSYTVKWWFGWV